MDDFERLLNRKLKDPEFKQLWESSAPEYQIAKDMMKARIESGMTQQQLSEKTGINQSNLCRIERGDGNPSVETLKRIAAAMGKTLTISFS